MDLQKNKILYSAVLIFSILMVPEPLFAQDSLGKVYQKRAEEMFQKVWNLYKVPNHTGLFTENYPAGQNDTLNYFQGATVSQKEVSFLWLFSGMFSATNVLMKSPALINTYQPYQDLLVTGIEKYRDTVRQPAAYQAYPVAMEKSDRYYDDNGLVGIDYMEAYFLTKNPVYLQRSKQVFSFIVSGWNDDAGGGVPWLEGHNDQKPACTNGMATLTALKIFEGSKDKYYLNQGIRFYTWMYSTLKDQKTGIIANDMKTDGKLNLVFWSYNTGSLIESAALLYKFTGDKKYLLQAKQLAADSYKYFTSVPHDQRLKLHIDLPWFITVLFRGYEALYHHDHNYTYLAAIEKDLNFAWKNSKDQYGLITKLWTPKSDELKKPKWLLDQACIIELYARLSNLKFQNNRP